jgi:stage IV sporulation protein FB
VIEFREPPQTGFELRWSMFGVRFRVLPSFFLISALLSAFFVWQVVGNNPVLLAIGIALDVACIFFAFVFTELVQGLVYRSYGLRSTVVLRELGGGIYPEAPPPTVLQRIVVALASPASSFLLFAIVHYSDEYYHWSDVNQLLWFAYKILWIISLFWGIIGLLPIFPYPGGRVLLEVMNVVSPRNGLVLTLGISILLGIAYVAYTFAVIYMRQPEIPLVRGVSLPASILLAIFIALATMQNWQLLQYARATRGRPSEPVDDYGDRAPWEK